MQKPKGVYRQASKYGGKETFLCHKQLHINGPRNADPHWLPFHLCEGLAVPTLPVRSMPRRSLTMTLGKRQSLAAPEDLSTISLGDATISTYRGEDDALDQDDDDNVNDFDDRTVGPGAWSEDSYAEMSEEKKNEEEDEDRELSGHGSVMIPAGLRLTMNQGTKKMDKRETGKRKTSNSSDDGRQSSSDDSTGPGSALRRKFGNDNFCHKSSRSSSKPRALSSHTALSGSGRAQPASATYDKARATIEYRIRQKALEQSVSTLEQAPTSRAPADHAKLQSDYFLDVVLNLCRDPLKDNTSLPELKARLSAIQDEAEDVRQLQYCTCSAAPEYTPERELTSAFSDPNE